MSDALTTKYHENTTGETSPAFSGILVGFPPLRGGTTNTTPKKPRLTTGAVLGVDETREAEHGLLG